MSQDFSAPTAWIWCPLPGEWVMFRKGFPVSQDCRSAVLCITAGVHYIAYLNGQVVARGPGRSYDFAKVYDEVSAASWRCLPHAASGKDSAGYAIPLGHEEQFDARLELTGWTQADFDDSAWSAAPAVYLPEQILGIYPLEPGYQKFRIAPFASDLEWARGSVATAHGPIYVAWQRTDDGAITIDWTAPDECQRVD